MDSDDRLARFVYITESGALGSEIKGVRADQREAQRSINRKAHGDDSDAFLARSVLDFVAVGDADYVSMQAVADLRYLAVPTVLGGVRHVRSTGAALPLGADYAASDRWTPDDPQALVTRDWARFHANDRGFPFLAVMYLKVDPLVNITVGDRIVGCMVRRLESRVRRKLDEFARQCADRAPKGEDWAPWPVLIPDDGGDLCEHLQILPLVGLDAAELILLVRVQRLDLLVRLAWALRCVHAHEVLEERPPTPADWTELAAASYPLWTCLQPDVADVSKLARWIEDSMARVPMLAHTSTTLGMPYEELSGAPKNTGGTAWDREAFRYGRLVTRLRVLPGGMARADEALDELSGSSDRDTSYVSGPSTMSVAGRHDILCEGGGGPATGPGPCTVRQFAKVLALSVQLDEGSAQHFTSDTLVALKAFPPWISPRRLVPDALEAGEEHGRPSLLGAFYQQLVEVRPRWVGQQPGEPAGIRLSRAERPEEAPAWAPFAEKVEVAVSLHRLLLQAAKRGNWSYSRTNAAVNLVASLAAVLGNRVEIEAFLDLAEPLLGWILEVHRVPQVEYRESIDRIYKGLDRLVRARGRRDGAHRPPDVIRCFEAQAGHVMSRNALQALIMELLRGRGFRSAPPLLLDGAESDLFVKLALGTGIFTVSALRLHHPALWAAAAGHECEHVRLYAMEPSDDWLRTLGEWAWKSKARWWAGTQHAPLVAETAGMALREMVERVRGSGSQARPWNTWRTVVKAVVEAGCDIAILDGPALPVEAQGTERETYFLWTLLPNLVMALRRETPVPPEAERMDRWLHIVAGRLVARLATALALASGASLATDAPLRVAANREDVRRGVVETLRALAAPCEELPRSVEDLFERAKSDLCDVLDEDLGWLEAARVMEATRHRCAAPVPGGAAQALGRHLRVVCGDVPDPAEAIAATHPRGGLRPESPVARRQAEQHLALLESMRLSIRRWRGHGLQSFLTISRYCDEDCDVAGHQRYFNAPMGPRDPRELPPYPDRWMAVVVPGHLSAEAERLIDGLSGPDSSLTPFPFLHPDRWGRPSPARSASLLSLVPEVERHLLPGVRVVAASAPDGRVCVVGLDPAALRPAERTRVPYTALHYYCSVLLGLPPDSEDQTLLGEAHRVLPPPPKLWVNGAVCLFGDLAAKVFRQA